jgi:hypothetical protein
MARKTSADGVNKSQAIRDMYAKNPDIKAKDLISELAAQGIEVKTNLVYLIKGKLKGEKKRRRRNASNAADVAVASGSNNALATIKKVKALASEVGGLRTLKAIVDALSE